MNYNEPFKIDKKGIYYIDGKDVDIKCFHFDEVILPYSKKRDFYYINGVSDYIIKDTTELPIYFNEYYTKKLLKNFYKKQDINDIDFPVGYYLENDKIKGTIIPYYRNSLSIRYLTNIYKFSDLKKYYYHDDDERKNLISLCLDILTLIERMYQKNIVYTDINAGNFLVYNNTVKVIDFEPDYVHFTKMKERYERQLLCNYAILVEYIYRHYGFKDVLYNPGQNFFDASDRVKSLIKKRG